MRATGIRFEIDGRLSGGRVTLLIVSVAALLGGLLRFGRLEIPPPPPPPSAKKKKLCFPPSPPQNLSTPSVPPPPPPFPSFPFPPPPSVLPLRPPFTSLCSPSYSLLIERPRAPLTS